MRRWWCWALVLAACGGDPPLSIKFRITDGATRACYTDDGARATSCSDVQIPCDAVASIQIAPPGNPSAPYSSTCQRLIPGGSDDACLIAGVDLPAPAKPIPSQPLLVTMAVYPMRWTIRGQVHSLPTDAAGRPECPPKIQLATDGFPVELDPDPGCDATVTDPTDGKFCWPVPAIGGSAYYRPGDSETMVDLGCTDITELTDPVACAGQNEITVSATVDDFDTGVSVAPSTADRLTVQIGEPGPTPTGTWALNPADEAPLGRTVPQPIPGWGANVQLMFQHAACLAVLEDDAQATTTLTCRQLEMPGTNRIDLTGVRLAKDSLADVLSAIGATSFPEKGLVVGIVLDYLGDPLANMTVTPSSGTVEYLSADRRSIVAGATSTSTNGIFVSQDAPFATIDAFGETVTSFTVQQGGAHAPVTGWGGLVDGKVTIVVLQFRDPVGS